MKDKPQNLGSYEVIRKIGEGGFGIVYLGLHTILGRNTGLKLFKRERIAAHRMDEFVDRFIREARILAALDHEYIVKIYDIFYTDFGPCIAMEYVNGRSLSEIDLTTLSEEKKLAYFIAVLEGMEAVHKKGIVHRDIKFANILIDSVTDKVKITDFGIAFQMDTELAEKDFKHLIGTWQYMSPEQVQGKKLDIYSDIWSLGVVLYRLFTGKLPFPGKDKKQLKKAICKKTYYRPSRVAKVPGWLDKVVDRCLQVNVEDRYQSCSEMLRDIPIKRSFLRQEMNSDVLLAQLVRTVLLFDGCLHKEEAIRKSALALGIHQVKPNTIKEFEHAIEKGRRGKIFSLVDDMLKMY